MLDGLVALVSYGLPVLTLVGSGLVYVRASARKEYAAERDMAHLKRHYQELAHSLVDFEEETSEKLGQLLTEIGRLHDKVDNLSRLR